jgi:hypothetical protein
MCIVAFDAKKLPIFSRENIDIPAAQKKLGSDHLGKMKMGC